MSKKLKALLISLVALLLATAIMLVGVLIGLIPPMIIGAVFMFISGVSIITLASIIFYDKHVQNSNPNIIYVKAKPSRVVIDCKNKVLKYKKAIINVADIVSYELIDKTQTVLKSGFGESVVGGMLFGAIGAAAGAYAGKGEKVKEKFKFYIRTKDIQNAGIVINLKLDDGFKLYETVDLMIKGRGDQK